MQIAIAGGHGKIALLTAKQLSERGDEVLSLVRNPEHDADIRAAGARPVAADLEQLTVDELAERIAGSDAVVFAAGAGPNSGLARKDAVDRGGAVLLAEAAQKAGIRRYLLVSSMGVEGVRDGATPEGVGEVFVAYLRAKLAAEDDLRARQLDWTVLRPGGLTDDPATGAVQLTPDAPRGQVPRADVAAVLVALLDEPRSAGLVLQLTEGPTPIDEALQAALR
ncbi:MAG TPA: SDR family oxidoreductase [Frankiaceae bacterium]|nr:SDR family oxidoreductase [Frankiaceae bacterium]